MKTSDYMHQKALEADTHEEGIFQMLNAIFHKLNEIQEDLCPKLHIEKPGKKKKK